MFFIDTMDQADCDGLLDIIESGIDYPYWYRKAQSNEDVVNDYRDRLEKTKAGQSDSVYKAIRTIDGRLIGCVYFDPFDKKTGDAGLNYFLHGDCHGKGLGGKAVREAVRKAVVENGLKSLHATVHPEKVASMRILLGLGLTVTGFIKGDPYRERDGRPAPRVVMAASAEKLAAALEK